MNGLYEISNLGRVKALLKTVSCWNGFSTITYTMPEKILAQRKRSGYLAVGLTKDNKQSTFSIHRLVAEAFIPNPDELPQVNHKDEDKTNNCVNNLEWCDNKYNINYSLAKIVQCVETGVLYDSLTSASKMNNIDLGLLSRVCGKNDYTARWLSLEIYKQF